MASDKATPFRAALGPHHEAIDQALRKIQSDRMAERLWSKDHTLWKEDPTEITDRLGWLTIAKEMSARLGGLQTFTEDIRREGYTDVVLLGMGGSSLGPEVLGRTFGRRDGYPRLTVLDSTVPQWVQAVTSAIDPARTVFIVSSKSGATIEPLSLYKHFRAFLERIVAAEDAGKHFVAVTDPETPLAHMAAHHGFRRAFLNPPDIGGRYSVLSYFGLLPAALMGADAGSLLDRARQAASACEPDVPQEHNASAHLAAVMAAMAMRGRDKLTLIASPSIAGFGVWVEQLVAESTGKEGSGIIPVADEPLLPAGCYSSDRLFIYLRMEGDDNTALDAAVQALEHAGQPIFHLGMQDRYDIGAQFFLWQFATALAGALLGIHPFDQPDVQAAKDETDRLLAEYRQRGRVPHVEAPASLGALLRQAGPGDYLAIMAYAYQTPASERAFKAIRALVMERYRIATTLGYGPRFLHSTGQLHKGGPNSGLFLQVVEDARSADLAIPGEDYTFGLLVDAQANGDLQALRARNRRCARVTLAQAEAIAAGGLQDVTEATGSRLTPGNRTP